MSALIDSLTGGGFDGTVDGGVGNSSGSYFVDAPATPDYTSGALQSLMTLGTGYLARRLDVDLQTRVVGMQPQVGLRTTQNGIGGYGRVVKTPQGNVAAINLSAVLPLVVVAVIAFFLAKRG